MRCDVTPQVLLQLVRHAHIDTGDPPRLCGRLDISLSPRGRAELVAYCARAADTPPPSALYSSPLRRATETARVLAEQWGLSPREDPAFSEIDCGHFEGAPIPWIQQEHADLWRRNFAQTDDTFAWPGGESYLQLRERIRAGLARLAAANAGGRVVVVTHTGVITQVIGMLKGRPAAVWSEDRPAPLSLTEVAWVDGGPAAIIRFNSRCWR